jgi:aminopeptidase
VIPDPEAFATLLCEWCLDVHERDHVLVFTTPRAAPLVRALHRAAIARGAWPPGLRLGLPGLTEDFYKHAPDDLLDSYPPLDMAEIEHADAYLRIDAPENTRALAEVDPARIHRVARARAPIQELRLSRR